MPSLQSLAIDPTSQDAKDLQDTVGAGIGITPRVISPAAPAIIRGSADATTYAGITLGALADSAARQANGVALQAFLDWCASNGKYAEIPPGRYEYEATGTHNSRNVGLRVPRHVSLIGGGSSVASGTRLIQYAANHPVLTLGSLVADEYTQGARIRGLALGHGVSQTGQTSAEGLLIGEYWRSDFDDILVNPSFVSAFPPYHGIKIGATAANHFFSNRVGTLVCWGAQQSLFRQDAGGTGSSFENVYLGGGGFGNRVATAASPFHLNNSGSDAGRFGQLNIEWCAPADFIAPLAFTGCDGVDIAHLHLEGNRAGGSLHRVRCQGGGSGAFQRAHGSRRVSDNSP